MHPFSVNCDLIRVAGGAGVSPSSHLKRGRDAP